MRLVANVNRPDQETKRLMIYDSGDGVYLFGYKLLEDSHSNWDEWYASVKEAKESSETEYLVKLTEWIEIPDPIKGCQHDWINPVRVNSRNAGIAEFEKLENGNWVRLF